jgi:hypothetical protein
MNDGWAGPNSDDVAQPEDSGLADRLLRDEFARASADSATTAGVAVHQEFAEGGRGGNAVPFRATERGSRSHRAGTLVGLGVVGTLLAVLVVVAPGGSAPKVGPPTTPTTTTTTRPAASPTTTTTLHCILGPIC